MFKRGDMVTFKNIPEGYQFLGVCLTDHFEKFQFLENGMFISIKEICGNIPDIAYIEDYRVEDLILAES